MQWAYAVFGIVMLAVAVLAISTMSDDVRTESRMSRLGSYAFLGVFFALGVWLAWPLFALVIDLVRGTDTASAVVRAREVAQTANVRTEFELMRWFVDRAAMLGGVAAPFVWWGMRAREPEARRQWVVLIVGVLGGVLALAHDAPAAAAAVPLGGPLLESVGAVMARHELGSVLGLSWLLLWLGALASSTWTGLPVGPWTAFLLPGPTLPWWLGYYQEYSWWKQALCWIAAVVLGAILNEIRLAEQANEVAKRASRARDLSRKLLDADVSRRPPFALYLRRFASTGRLDTQQITEESDPLDLETVLSQALRPELRLVGLNRRQAAAIVGADYLFGLDAEWQANFHRLAQAASLIVMLPPEQGSTLDEITWLVDQNLLRKVLFLMPETVTGEGIQAQAFVPSTFKVTEMRMIDHAPAWATARAAVLEHAGLTLPEYRSDGAVFALDSTGDVRALEPLRLSRSMFKVLRLRKVVNRVQRAQMVGATLGRRGFRHCRFRRPADKR